MSASKPELPKRSPPGEAAGNGGEEVGAEEGRPSVPGEILARLEVIDRRLEERKCPAAGPTKAAFEKLAKAVGSIGESVGQTRKLVGGLVETDPDYKAAVDAAVGLSGTAGQLPGGFGALGRRGPAQAAVLEGGGAGRRRPGRPAARRAGATAVPGDRPERPEWGLERMDMGDARPRHRRLRGRGDGDGCRGGLCAGGRTTVAGWNARARRNNEREEKQYGDARDQNIATAGGDATYRTEQDHNSLPISRGHVSPAAQARTEVDRMAARGNSGMARVAAACRCGDRRCPGSGSGGRVTCRGTAIDHGRPGGRGQGGGQEPAAASGVADGCRHSDCNRGVNGGEKNTVSE